MTKTFQNTLQAKTLALFAAGFIGLSTFGAAPALADNECTGGSNTRCGESRAEEEARLAEADRRAEEARLAEDRAQRAREAEAEAERRDSTPSRAE